MKQVRKRSTGADGGDSAAPRFDPVPLRQRHDGWTPERQLDFIEALGETACVEDACKAVGLSAASAYALRRRIDAQSFRMAWDAALDYGIRRLSDAVIGRAINGVARPVFYKGEQVGERRYYDERLAIFLLRTRDPTRYGVWRDAMRAEQHPDGPAMLLAYAVDRLAENSFRAERGLSTTPSSSRDAQEEEPPELAAIRADFAARLGLGPIRGRGADQEE